MANWYVSSVAYTAVARWAASTTYAVGNIVRQLAAPAVNSERCFRVSAITTGISGGTEPAWTLTHNGTTTDGGVTWTECTGQEAYQQIGSTSTWTAPAARHNDITSTGNNGLAAGDTIFYSSDHAETQATALTLSTLGQIATPCYFLSVNRTSGNVPPLSADLTPGASFSLTGNANFIIGTGWYEYWYGCTFNNGTASIDTWVFGNSVAANKQYFSHCNFTWTSTGQTSLYVFGSVICDTCTITPNSTSQNIYIHDKLYAKVLTLAGTLPTVGLFSCSSFTGSRLEIRDSDISNFTGQLLTATSGNFARVGLYNCKISSSMTLAGSLSSALTLLGGNPNGNQGSEADVFAEFINCDSGNTAYVNTRWSYFGEISTTVPPVSISLVGSASGSAASGNATATATLTTTAAGRIFIFAVRQAITQANKPVSSITSTSGLTFNNRTSATWSSTSASNMDLWWADASAPLTNEVITVTWTNTDGAKQIIACGFSGITGFDPNTSLPATSAPHAANPSVTISTNNANDCLLAFVVTANTTVPTGLPTGFTQILGANQENSAYENVAVLQSSAAISWPYNAFNYMGMIVDAATTGGPTLSGGASVNGQAIARKIVTQSNAYVSVLSPLIFDLIINNTITGVAKTATVEIISSATLTNAQLWATLEYLGSSASGIGSEVSSGPATVLTAASNIPSSSATWNNPPATPQAQHIQLSFTAEKEGPIRVRLHLAEPSTTIWVDPKITIS